MGRREKAADARPLFVIEPERSGVADRTGAGAKAPTAEDVMLELWKIATGEGSEASRVSALRALADIMGLLKPQQQELPEAMTLLLDALARGMGDGQGGGLPLSQPGAHWARDKG